MTKPCQWRHVPTARNPDNISRGCPTESLSSNKLWRNGSKWLSRTEGNWPYNNFVIQSELPELRMIRPILVIDQPPVLY